MIHSQTLKIIEIVDLKVYRNKVLSDWIKENFETDIQRGAAYATVAFIRKTWPETEKALLGQLVEEEKQ